MESRAIGLVIGGAFLGAHILCENPQTHRSRLKQGLAVRAFVVVLVGIRWHDLGSGRATRRACDDRFEDGVHAIVQTVIVAPEGIAALQCANRALQTVLRDERIEACVVTIGDGDDP